jgi:hypothetical protein
MPEASQQDEQIELILPIGPPGCFLEVSKVAQTIGLLFPRNKVCISFGIKQWVGPHFGRNFHQHFRSPCFQGTWKVILKYYVQAALQIEWFHRAIFFFCRLKCQNCPGGILGAAHWSRIASCRMAKFKKISQNGKPMWLSGKVMEWENKRNQKDPGSLTAQATFQKSTQNVEFICSFLKNRGYVPAVGVRY